MIWTGTTTVPFTECYDAQENEWFEAASMNLNRSALAACVCKNLPNARDYSYLSKIAQLHPHTTNSGDSGHVYCIKEGHWYVSYLMFSLARIPCFY